MILSGAIFGDLCDFEAIKVGRQLGKLGVQWQLDLMRALEAGFEGARHEADTETYVRLIEGGTVSNHRCEHEMQTNFPADAPSHTRKDKGRVLRQRLPFPCPDRWWPYVFFNDVR